MVEDDIHDLGLYSYSNRAGHIDHPSKVHHWQLGFGIWYLSEMLSLMNFFFPFGKQMEKKVKLQQEINKREQLSLDYNKPKKIQNQNHFKGIGKRSA